MRLPLVSTGPALALCCPLPIAADLTTATKRTNAENYKGRALAICIADAYEGTTAGDDARMTASGFIEWLYFDQELGNSATRQLTEQYLRRDYSTPLEGYEGVEFKLLKCIDMFYSEELEQQARKYTSEPDWAGELKQKQEPDSK